MALATRILRIQKGFVGLGFQHSKLKTWFEAVKAAREARIDVPGARKEMPQAGDTVECEIHLATHRSTSLIDTNK